MTGQTEKEGRAAVSEILEDAVHKLQALPPSAAKKRATSKVHDLWANLHFARKAFGDFSDDKAD